MPNVYHKNLVDGDLHAPGYVQASDPGAVGAGIQWVDTTLGTGKWVTKVRNATNTAWELGYNITGIMELVYPVGRVVTLGVSTNPATLFGVGTWTAITGKVIVGIDAGQTEFDTLDETGGEKSVTLTSAQSGLPAHTHNILASSGTPGAVANLPGNYPNALQQVTNATEANVAANAAEAHTNLQPYIVKYVWQRTA